MSRKCFGLVWPRPNGTADFSRAFQSFRILCERMGRAHGEWARRRLSITGRLVAQKVVAQICNLLYRRVELGQAFEGMERPIFSTARQNEILRYSRLTNLRYEGNVGEKSMRPGWWSAPDFSMMTRMIRFIALAASMLIVVSGWVSTASATEEICGACNPKVIVSGEFFHRNARGRAVIQGAPETGGEAFVDAIFGTNFTVSVPNLAAGRYTARFGFAETEFKARGSTRFDITCGDQRHPLEPRSLRRGRRWRSLFRHRAGRACRRCAARTADVHFRRAEGIGEVEHL